jgi:prefoldin subunit 5
MTRKELLAPQVKRLLSGVSDQGNQHLTEVETDLVQTTFLLSEAIEKLGASFMAIHEAVSKLQETVDTLMADAKPSPENAERLSVLRGEIGKHINAAVTGLQFQDMTSQLIGRTVRRVTGLREVLNALGSGSAGVLPESDIEEIAEILHKLNEAIETETEKLESVLWKPVQQTHMESGDIELF